MENCIKNFQLDATIDEFFSQMPGHIYLVSADGIVLNCNDQQAKSLGYSTRFDLIGKSLYEIFPNKDEVDVLQELNRMVIQQGGEHELEESITLFNGEKAYFKSHKKRILNRQQEVIGVGGSAVNITAMKIQESVLHENKKSAEEQKNISEIWLKNIIANLPICVFWEDVNGVILGMNEEQAHALGLQNAKDLIGKSIYDTTEVLGWNKTFIDKVRANDATVIRDGITLSREEEMNFPDGSMRIFLSKKAPLRDDNGKCIGLLGSAIDITEQKLLENKLKIAKEKAEEANLAKTSFIANVTHDLRTPLQSILSAAEMLELKSISSMQKEYTQIIFESGKNLLHLVDSLLEFASFEEEGIQTRQQLFNLKVTLNNCVSVIKSKAEEKKIALNIHYADNLPEYYISDSNAISRIVLNLLSNAVKFTSKGFIHLSAIFLDKKQDRITLAISVEDSGIGIDESKQSHIFERFYRANPAYQNQYEGFGLGLSITKKLIDNLNASISVTSQLQKGSKFTCTFTLKCSEFIESVDNAILDKQKSIFLSKTRGSAILLIEDVPLIQKILLHFLTEIGCAVTLAASAKEAISSLDAPYDLIFMDIGLPDQDGFYVIEKIRNSDTVNKLTPIIAITAHASNEIKERCYQAGATDFLVKPIAFADLLACIKQNI